MTRNFPQPCTLEFEQQPSQQLCPLEIVIIIQDVHKLEEQVMRVAMEVKEIITEVDVINK